MIEQIPTAWLVDQEVPLVFFIVALVTKPHTWTNRVNMVIDKILDKEGKS